MKKKRKGFTLVELVIVIAVIAVLAAVLVPTFSTVMEKAHNSADTQLVRNMNTVMSTNLDENVTATAENLRKYLKDNGITDIETKNSDVVIVYNKTTKQFERMNVKKTLGNKDGEISVMRAKAEGKEEIFTKNPYSPEEIFTDRIIVSTEGNDLAEGLYALHNIENEEDVANKKNILKNIDGEILSKLETIVVTTLYVGKDGDPFRLTLSGGAISVNNDSGSNTVKRVVFNEECTTVNLEALADKTTGSNVYVVIPDTVESVENAETAKFDDGTRFFGNTDILENAGAENIQKKVAESSISEMQEKFFGDEGESLKELVGTTKFYVSGEASGIDHYTSLVDALSAAAQSAQNDPAHAEKYVYLQKNYELSANITIPEHVTLVLPYDGKSETAEAKHTITENRGIFAIEDEETYCKLTLTMSDGIILTNNGTIMIGGEVCMGGGGIYGAGETSRNFAKISLEKDAKIESYGDMDVYGFIEEVETKNGSSVTMHSGKLTMPFIVGEHRGGSIFTSMYGKMNGSPFNRFFMQNIISTLTIESNAELIGHTGLRTDTVIAQDNETDIKLIGNTDKYLINLIEDSKVTAYYNKSGDKAQVTDLDIFGSFTFNSLSIDIKVAILSASLSTKDVLFPLSWYWNVNLHPLDAGTNAIVTFNQDIKLLPGASLTIGAGVKVKAGKICVYDTFQDVAVGTGNNVYESDKSAAKLIINGELEANSVGGTVLSEQAGAKFICTENSCESNELTAKGPTWTPTNWNLKLKTSVSEATEAQAGTYISGDDGVWTLTTEA